jgi:hypothetical protein
MDHNDDEARELEVIRPEDFLLPAAAMDEFRRQCLAAKKKSTAELVRNVKAGIQRFTLHDAPDIMELRQRFRELRGHAQIEGCNYWSEFCAKVLNYTPRHLRRILGEE